MVRESSTDYGTQSSMMMKSSLEDTGVYWSQTNVGGGNLMKTSSCESSVGKNSSLENCSQVFKVQVLNVVYVWSGRDVFFSSSVPYSSVASPEPVTEEVASVAVIEA